MQISGCLSLGVGMGSDYNGPERDSWCDANVLKLYHGMAAQLYKSTANH